MRVAVSTSELRNNGSYTTSYALLDGLMRPHQSQTPSADGTGRVITETIYDNRGQVLDSNGPFYNGDAPTSDLFLPATDVQFESQTRNTYDGAGRLAVQAFRVLGVEKWRTTTTYGGDRVTVDPPTGTPPTTTVSDARGRTAALRQYRATSPTGAYEETKYTHTPDGKAKTIMDPAGNVWSYEYDQRGRQTRANDPDRGTTVTTYDDGDQVMTVTDARGQRLAYAYDLLGRRTAIHKDSLAGAKVSSWVFDAVRDAEDKPIKGQVASSTRWMGENAYTTTVTGYDAMYRPTGSKVSIPANEGELAGDYNSALTYNIDGGIKEMGLPAAPGLPTEKLTLKYDDLGQLKVTNGHGAIVNGTKYSPFGEVLQLTHGNTFGKFVWQTFAYEQGTRRLTQATVQREALAGTASDIDYAYDPAGNVTKISDAATNQPADTQCFNYDHLRRLTQAWTPTNGCAVAPSTALLGGPAPYWHSYEYDVTGNRTKEIQHAPAGDTTRTYEYPDAKQPKPHALTKATIDSIAGQRLDTFEYDEVGNTTVRSLAGARQTLTWDDEGHVSSATDSKGKTEYVYDATGERLIRRDPTATTLYLDGTEIKLDRASKAKTSTRYYTHNGMTIAVRAAAGVQFLAPDHHGTAEVAVHSATQAVTRRRSLPFGGPREASPAAWVGDRGFVGGTIDASTGLTHLGAREYDPDRGRFISVDSVIDYANPQQMNGYSYANNNPTTLSDPTGLSPEDAQWDDGNGCESCDKAAEQRYGTGGGGSAVSNGKKSGVPKRTKARMPSVKNDQLRAILSQIYNVDHPNADWVGDGTTGDALTNELLTGEKTAGSYHAVATAQRYRALTKLLEVDRKAGLKGESILSGDERATAEHEARKLLSALNTTDHTGKVGADLEGDQRKNGEYKKALKEAIKSVEGARIMGADFQAREHKAPKMVNRPRGRGLIAGSGLVDLGGFIAAWVIYGLEDAVNGYVYSVSGISKGGSPCSFRIGNRTCVD